MEWKAAFSIIMNVYRFVLEINKNNKDSYKHYLEILYPTEIRGKENFLNNKSFSVQFFPAWFYCHTGLLIPNILYHSVK